MHEFTKKKCDKFKFVLIIFFLLATFSSCTNSIPEKLTNVLKFAGENKKELEAVFDHYKSPKDSLKLKAAYFLIENMPRHKYITGRHIEKYSIAFDSLEKIDRKAIKKKMKIAHQMVDSLNNLYLIRRRTVKDIETINAEFLIENIDYAFKAWNENPSQSHLSFKEFCNYILPYRSQNEILEKGLRKHFYEKYNWVIDSLKKGKGLEETLVQMMSSTYFNYQWESIAYPYSYKITQLEKKGFGICSDITPYWILALRSIGIPCAYESIPHWGNHHSSGHDWLAVKIDDKFSPIDPFVPEFNVLNKIIKQESTPKVYRKTYASNLVDVSHEYINTQDISVNIVMNKIKGIKDVLLYVFDKKRAWVPVANGEIIKDKAYFKDIGQNCVYLMGYDNYGKTKPLNYPFKIDSLGKVKIFNLNQGILDSAIILRKYQPYSPFENFKRGWSTSLNECKIEGSNSKDFSNSKTLFTISGFNSSHMQTFYLKNKTHFYKNYRLVSHNKSDSYISELAFYDKFKNKLIGTPFGDHSSSGKFDLYYNLDKNVNYVFDNNSLTYYGGKDYTIGMAFDIPKKVHSIKIQARNDDNHININDFYELLYWNNDWISLGKKKATDTMLVYKNIPKGALYWLKNNSRGDEEHVFTFNENGKQIWSSSLSPN